MKYILLIVTIFLTVSCDKHISKEVPIKETENIEEPKIQIESKIEMLKNEVNSIDESSVTEKLDRNKRNQFLTELKDLKMSLNQTISLMRLEYSKEQNRALKTSYYKTKEIWDYLIRNYEI